MKIRALTIQDFPHVNDFMMMLHERHVKYRPDIYRPIQRPTTPKAWDFNALLQRESSALLGAEIEGNLAGICMMTVDEPASSPCMQPRIRRYIHHICVHQDFRRRGIGMALYHTAAKYTAQRGAESIELMVWNFNEEAIRFYQSLGMTV